MNVEILDCTLRDGSHAIKGGFTAAAAAAIVGGLLGAGVRVIEFGKASGIGSPKGSVSDEAYLEAVAPHLGKGEVGMFCRPECFGDAQFGLARTFRLGFLRVGTDAGKVEPSAPTIARIREAGIKARYSLIQADRLSPAELAASARKVASYGAQAVTIMDSTGTMLPAQVQDAVAALVDAVDVPVGFHGHNNLGLSIANALAALEAGASSLDGALIGLARSAGNAPTEMLAAVLARTGRTTSIDLFGLFTFIEDKLRAIVDIAPAVAPLDIVFGLAAFHSKNLPLVEAVAREAQVDLLRLVVEAGRTGKATLDEATTREAATRVKATQT